MTAPFARLDAAGIALSALCIVHCLAVPLVATGALAWAASERIHVGLTVSLAAIVLIVAAPSYRRHRRPLVPTLLVSGLAILVAALILGEAAGETAEVGLTVLGSVVLMAGHVLNLRLRPLT